MNESVLMVPLPVATTSGPISDTSMVNAARAVGAAQHVATHRRIDSGAMPAEVLRAIETAKQRAEDNGSDASGHRSAARRTFPASRGPGMIGAALMQWQRKGK